MNNIFDRMIVNLTDTELNQLRVALSNQETYRTQGKIIRGEYKPMIKAEKELVRQNNRIEAVKRYSDRAQCSFALAFAIIKHYGASLIPIV